MKTISVILFIILTGWSGKAQTSLSVDVYFNSDKDKVEKSEIMSLDSLIQIYLYGIERVELLGRTDSTGSPEHNYNLASDRVNAVASFLERRGLAEAGIRKIIYAEKHPLADNESAAGRRKNRSVRVVIYVREDFTSDVSYLYKLLAPEASNYEISSNQPTTIRTQQGTIVSIPANSFVGANNQPVWGKVNVEITECYNYRDMMLSNLTTSTGDGQLLETGGMIKVVAKRKDKEFSLKPGSSIQIKIPADSLRSDMQIFWGMKYSADQTLWVQPDALVSDRSFYVKTETLNYNFDLLYKENLTKAENDSLNFLIQELSSKGRPVILATLIGKLVQKKEEVKLNRVLSILKIQEIRFMSNYRQRNESQLASAGLYLYKGKTMRYLSLDDPHFAGIDFKQVDYIYYSLADKEYGSEVDSTLNIHRINIDNYILNASALGWINCDRFLSDPNRVNIYAKSDSSFRPVYRLIFSEFKAMLPGSVKMGEPSLGVISNIPSGAKAKLIAYAMKDGNLYFASKDIQAKANQVEKMELQPVSMEEFKRLLTGLNKRL